MTGKEATVYCVFWISMAAAISTSVVACKDYNIAYGVRGMEIDAAQWNALRDDCNKHGGLMKSAWGKWECELK